MRLIKTTLFLLLVSFFYSCEKVIELKLDAEEIKYVIEGIITNKPGDCKVYVSQSRPFYENNQFTGISGVNVVVYDNGNAYPLTETGAGIYENKQLNGMPGHVYELSVTINGESFTATCTMPQPVYLDKLFIAPGPFGQFDFATIEYTDPVGIKNFYRYVQYVNNVKDPAIFWDNDEFADGLLISRLLDTGIDKKDDPRNIESGDIVTIELLSLDESIYTYWYSLQSDGGAGSGSAIAPANPLTNIKGGALGYFSAHTLDSKTVIAP